MVQVAPGGTGHLVAVLAPPKRLGGAATFVSPAAGGAHSPCLRTERGSFFTYGIRPAQPPWLGGCFDVFLCATRAAGHHT